MNLQFMECVQERKIDQNLTQYAKLDENKIKNKNEIDQKLITTVPLLQAGVTPRRKAPYRDSKLTLLLKGSTSYSIGISTSLKQKNRRTQIAIAVGYTY